MSSAMQLLDAAGRRRSPATMPDFHARKAPGNKGQRYAADPPTVDEMIAVMRHAGHARYGNRLSALIVVLWRALACRATDQRGALAQRDRSRGTARVNFGQAREERPPPPSRDGRVGLVSAGTVAVRARNAAGRTVVLRDRRTHARTRLVGRRREAAAAPDRPRGGGPAALRAPPAPPCTRCRVVA